MMDIESRSLEVLITRVDERKNSSRDLGFATKEQGQFTDGIAFKGTDQVLLVEAGKPCYIT
jgi:hypothetical protein